MIKPSSRPTWVCVAHAESSLQARIVGRGCPRGSGVEFVSRHGTLPSRSDQMSGGFSWGSCTKRSALRETVQVTRTFCYFENSVQVVDTSVQGVGARCHSRPLYSRGLGSLIKFARGISTRLLCSHRLSSPLDRIYRAPSSLSDFFSRP